MKVICNDGTVRECAPGEELHVLRHSAAHIMAQAVSRLYPGTHFAYGPATETGFYYDIDPGDHKIGEADLPAIEKEMRRICKENLPFRTFSLSREEAKELLAERGEIYKLEHVDDLPEDTELHFYQQGDYIDMCSGPHITSTAALKAFQLTGLSGAYWKADKSRQMLTRISGIAFRTNEELKAHLTMLEEAVRRDHRKIGREMELFLTSDAGPGFPFFLDKGLILKNLLIDYWRELHRKNGYIEISTPQILNRSLWETSGHWTHYRDRMYTTRIDDEDYAIKPMNCPGGLLVYKSRPHSYRELPIRCGELGLVHRNELKGTLHGLFRVRCLTQDDAHIFMTREQIPAEIKGVIRLIDEVYGKFGFSYHVELSTRPEDSMGSDEDWEAATEGLRQALNDSGLDYRVNEGDGAFYGPKIDFHLKDSIGRTWQCGTIQLDFQLPQNFEIEYIDENSVPRRPIMIHRTIYGSLERFIGILIEHYAGKFPLWLAPVQVRVLPVSEKALDYAKSVYERLEDAKIRCELDARDEKIGYKIREAQQVGRVPYMLIIGAKEEESGTITVRDRDTAESVSMTMEEFLAEVKERNEKRIS